MADSQPVLKRLRNPELTDFPELMKKRPKGKVQTPREKGFLPSSQSPFIN